MFRLPVRLGRRSLSQTCFRKVCTMSLSSSGESQPPLAVSASLRTAEHSRRKMAWPSFRPVRMSHTEADRVDSQVLRLLLVAAAEGNMTELKRNLKFVGGPLVNKAGEEEGWTALMYAARNGHLEVIKLLVEKGARLDLANPAGMTAYDIALFWHRIDVVRFLQTCEQVAVATRTAAQPVHSRLDRCGPLREVLPFLEEALHQDTSRFVVFHDLNAMVAFDKKSHPHLLLATASQVAAFLPARLWQEDSPIAAVAANEQPVLFLGRMLGKAPTSAQFTGPDFLRRGFLGSIDPMDGVADEQEGYALFAVCVSEKDSEQLQKSIAQQYGLSDIAFLPSFPGLLGLRDLELRVAMFARSLLAWHDRHRFCPTCGQRSCIVDGGHKRVCSDTGCRSRDGVHNTCHPRVDPVVIVLVESPDGNSCLLGRSARFPSKMFSCVAGFVEVGEKLEEAVYREVQEETGVELASCQVATMPPSLGSYDYRRSTPQGKASTSQETGGSKDGSLSSEASSPASAQASASSSDDVGAKVPAVHDTLSDLRYVGSQPWPFPGSLMMGFVAKARTSAIDLHDGELAEARWFSVREMEAVFRAKSWRLRSGSGASSSKKSSDGAVSAGSTGSSSSSSSSSDIVSIPPPVAMAHQLIAHWLECKRGELQALNETALLHPPTSRL